MEVIKKAFARLNSAKSIVEHKCVFFGDGCTGTLKIRKHPGGEVELFEMVTTKHRVQKNAMICRFNAEFWREHELELCHIEVIFRLIGRYGLWRYVSK